MNKETCKDAKKIMCEIVPKKDMCHIDINASAYQKEQEELRKAQVQANNVAQNGITETAVSSENIIKSINNHVEAGSFQNARNLLFGRNKALEEMLEIKKSEVEAPNAHSIMCRFIQRVSVVTMNGKIFIYNGIYYVDSSTDDVRTQILALFRDEVKDHSPSFISNIVEYLRIEPTIRISDAHVSSEHVAFDNGILCLNTGEFIPHTPSIITMYSVRGSYLPNDNCYTPCFDRYMLMLCNNDPVLVTRAIQVLGYILTPDIKAKAIFTVLGPGSSGKSLLVKLLENLLSPTSFYAIQSDKLKNNFALAELFGRSLCVCQDMPNEALDTKAVSCMKCISGADTISSDVKFKSAITFLCRAKLLLVSNFGIYTKNRDDAFYSRLVAIPCPNSVPKSEQDPDLIQKLLAERNGIITKSMQAYFSLKQNGYKFAGDYQPNSAVDYNNYSEDVITNIYNFTKAMFEVDINGLVFTGDAFDLYLASNPNIARNKFSEIFKRACSELFGAEDGRRYKNQLNPNGEIVKSKNVLHCIIGVRFKEELY